MKLHGCVLSALAAMFIGAASAAAQDMPVGIEALGAATASSQPTTKPATYSISKPVLYPGTSPATAPATAPASEPAATTTAESATMPASEPSPEATTEAATETDDEAMAEPDEGNQPAQYETPSYYRTMIQELSIKGDQEKRLNDKVQEMLQAVDKFDSDNGGQIRNLQQGLVQAHKDKDLKLQNVLLKQLETLSKQRREMLDKHDAAILAVLTTKQRKAWDAFLLMAEAVKPLLPLEDDPKLALTQDQVTKIRNLTARRAPKFAAVKGDAAKTAKQYEDLFSYIRKHVLTQQQRAKLDELEGRSTTTSASTQAGSTGTRAVEE